MLSKERVATFRRDGFLVAEHAVDVKQLAGLRGSPRRIGSRKAVPMTRPSASRPPTADRASIWRRSTAPMRPRSGGSTTPSEIDETYMRVMRDSAMTGMVAALIGPDVKHHHCKINLKLPGSHTEVRYHQDFAYTPHTNDDVVTALLMLDDMTAENGCLMVVPGSHPRADVLPVRRGAVHRLHRPRRGAGATRTRGCPSWAAPAASASCTPDSPTARSRTGRHRRAALYICVYSAADAFPIARNPMPSGTRA